jgi:hypothetical protein
MPMRKGSMARSCPEVRGRAARRLAFALLLIGGLPPQPGDAAEPKLPPALAHISYGGGDGSSCEQAVVIRDARNTREGAAAEQAWLVASYPGAQIKQQALSQEGKTVFDRFTLAAPGGGERQVCFDITGFFGVW